MDGLTVMVRPLTPDLWPALVELFGERGAASGCWCMYPEIGAAYRRRSRAENRASFREIVMRGPPPGLLAFARETPVGWCRLGPRAAQPALDRA